MKRNRRSRKNSSKFPIAAATAGCIATLLFSPKPVHAVPTETPEQETLRIARTLRPIPDEQWKEVAGEKAAERYQIETGDTLFGISKRLFGDPRYWPKIWALNNDSILNPHLIRPGKQIAFMPGTGVSLPAVTLETLNDAGGQGTVEIAEGAVPAVTTPGRSREWRNLPHQSWEPYDAPPAPETAAATDDGSFEKLWKVPPSRELPVQASTAAVPWLGEISGSTGMHSYFGLNEQVTIAPYEDLVEGTTYTITRDPATLTANGNNAYAYNILGTAKIIGKRGEDWLAEITQAREYIQRSDKLIPAPKRIPLTAPIAAPQALEGEFVMDQRTSSTAAAQWDFGFVDLGTEDGVREGMVFETFVPKDPATSAYFSDKETFPWAYLQVVQTTDNFSTVRIIAGRGEIDNGTPVKAMVDVSKLRGVNGSAPTAEPLPEEPPPPPPAEDLPPPEPEASPSPAAPVEAIPEVSTPSEDSDVIPETVQIPEGDANELDKYEGEERLGEGEKKELEQLEEHQTTEPAPTPSATPETAPLDDSELPPPPEEAAPAPEPAPAPPPAESATPAPPAEDGEILPEPPPED